MPPPPPPPASTPPPPARVPVLPRPAHHDARVRLLRAARQRAHSFAADGDDNFDHDRDHAAVSAAAAHVAVAIGLGHDQRDDKQHLFQASPGSGRDTGRWLALPSATAADDRHHQLHRRHSSHLGTSTTPPARGSSRPRPRSATSTCTCASASAAAVAALPPALSQETLDRVEQAMAARLVADSQPPSPPSTTMLDLRLAAHDAPARAPPTLAAAAGLIAERRQAALPLPLAPTPRASALPPEPASSTTTLSIQDSAAPLTPPMMPHLGGPAPPQFPGGRDVSAGPSVAALQDELRLAAEVGQALLAQHEHAAHQLATLQRAHTLLAADRDTLASDRDDLRRARDTLIDQLRAAHSEIDRLRSALAAAESAAATHQRSLAATSHHLAATTAKLAAATDAEAATRAALEQLEEQLDEARAALRRASTDAKTHRDAAQTAAKERDAANEALAAAEANVHRITILATAEQARANDLDAVARQAVAERDAAVAQLEQVLDLLAAAQQGQPGGASPRSDAGRSVGSGNFERTASPTSGYGSSPSAPRESDGSDADDPDARRGRSRWLAARASHATLDMELSRSDMVMSPPPQPPPSEEEEEEEEERSVWTPAPVATRVPPTPPTERDEGGGAEDATSRTGGGAATAAVVPGANDALQARTRSRAPSIDDDQATSDGSDAEPDAEPCGGGGHDEPTHHPSCLSTPLPHSEPTAAFSPPTPTPTPPCAHCAAWAHTAVQLAAALRDLQAQIADADPVALARARKRDDPTSTPPLDAMYAQADRALSAIADAARALPSQLATETDDAADLVSAVADHVAEAADAKRAFHDVARAYVTVLEQKAAAASSSTASGSSSGSPVPSEKRNAKKRTSTLTSSSGGSQTSTGAGSATSGTRKWVAWLGTGSRASPALTSASMSPPPPVPPLPVRRSPSPATTSASDRSQSPLAGKAGAVRNSDAHDARWAAVAATASVGAPRPRGRPARSATAPAVPSPSISPSSSNESVTAGAGAGWRPARWIRGLRRRGSEEEDEPVVGTTTAVVVVGTGVVAQQAAVAKPHAAVTNTWGGEVRATMGP
ncbi:hypothetical protein AMAG_00919 [Allomyces macrogynus ATCC 38327]|uniref:Uncharacterized protein n=1 Tax=Allomyces macrogynus (strain ATCC 38327) TaxID=578462 RepID=A0A0L0RX91_ALLM3|nr:hypothetical protein AMAG_00919 [Allomyces macrogynus ATCC 38327]|eukprot:KNE54982.1 hypothetical protein AMAG_00919 [Allomyces macrogynus ATCC 38327]